MDLLRSTSRTTWSQAPRKYEDIHDGFSTTWQTTEIQFATHESPLRFSGMEVKVVLSDEGDTPWTRRGTSKKFFDGARLGYDRSPAFRRRRNRDVPQNQTSSFPRAYEKAEPTTREGGDDWAKGTTRRAGSCFTAPAENLPSSPIRAAAMSCCILGGDALLSEKRCSSCTT